MKKGPAGFFHTVLGKHKPSAEDDGKRSKAEIPALKDKQDVTNDMLSSQEALPCKYCFINHASLDSNPRDVREALSQVSMYERGLRASDTDNATFIALLLEVKDDLDLRNRTTPLCALDRRVRLQTEFSW